MRNGFPVTDEGILALRLKVLRELGNKKYPREVAEEVAASNELTFDDLKALVAKHGWPNPDAMLRAAEVLERRLAIVSNEEVPVAPEEPAEVLPESPADATEQLLQAADESPTAATRRLAMKVRADLVKLQAALDAEAMEAEAAKKAEQIAAIEREIADLEEQAAQRRKLLDTLKGDS